MAKGWVNAQASNLPIARAYVKQCAPYVSPTLYLLVPHEVKNLIELAGGPMAVTEHMVLLYDPAWVQSVSVKVVATGLMHECMHVQLHHVRRGRSYPNPKLFYKASDLFINGVMVRQTHSVRTKTSSSTTVVEAPMWDFPEWALMPEQYGFEVGLTADEYYRLLEKHEDEKKKNCDNGEGEGAPGDGEEGAKERVMCGCCGGVTGNHALGSIEGLVDKNPDIARSDAERIRAVRQTNQALQEYMKSEAGRGLATGGWSELVEMSSAHFGVPWKTKLARVTRGYLGDIRTGQMDYSKRRPSRRSYLRGIMLPGLISYDPIVWFIVDSSASMGTKQLADALKVCADVMQQMGIREAYYLDADTEVKRDPIKIMARDLRSITILGRGGTNFIPAVALADKAKPRPSLVIYLTDGDGAAPEEAPRDMKFIWCIVPTAHKRIPASWGEHIILEDEKAA